MGKLRHGALEPAEPAARMAAATSVPRSAAPHPTSPIPAARRGGCWHPPPCSRGTWDVNPNGRGQPWRSKTRPSITPASPPPRSAAGAGLHCAEPEGLHIKAGPGWLPAAPAPRRAAPCPRAACLRCPRCPRSLPATPLGVRRARPPAAESVKGEGEKMLARGWDPTAASQGQQHLPSPGVRRRRRRRMRRKSYSHPELVLEHFGGCREGAGCSHRPHKTLPSAVPSTARGGRFPLGCRQRVHFWMSPAAPRRFYSA